jgi:8-oxo-dGTP pyrophosphatase MutT (NUDIX family)
MELLDVYNEEGKVTGKVVQRGTDKKEYQKGEHPGIVQIFIENSEGKFLIEKSSKDNGFKYLPVGGHIISGETPINGIIRETKEEIGLDLKEDEFKYLGFFIIDFPVRFIYYMNKDIDISKLRLQSSEVESVTYKTPTEMLELIDQGYMHPVHNQLMPKVLELSRKK